jgi:hypothetical protein
MPQQPPERYSIAEWDGGQLPVEVHDDGTVSTLDWPIARRGKLNADVLVRPPRTKAEREMIARAVARVPKLDRCATAKGTTVTWANLIGIYPGQHGTFEMSDNDAAKEMADFCRRGESLAPEDIPADLTTKIVERRD